MTRTMKKIAHNTGRRPIHLTLLLLLLLTSLQAKAQMDLNYIYLFDCTTSMKGFGGTPDIWDKAKAFLKDDIAKKPDNASITIIPFQHKCYDAFTFATKGDMKWGDVEKRLDGLVDTKTRTNIVDAWQKGLQSVNPNAYNIVYLLTDGIDNHISGHDCVADLCQLIRQSCGKKENMQLLYVKLTQFARDPRINAAIASCPDFSTIDGISPNLVLIGKRSFRMNARDGSTEVAIPVSDKNPFPVSARTDSRLFRVQVAGGQASNGIIRLRITRAVGVQQLSGLPQHLDFGITLSAPKAKAWIVNPNIKAEVVNKPEKTLTLAGNTSGGDMGRAGYYGAFLFVGESGPNPIGCDMQPHFNADAARAGATVTLKVSSDAKPDNDYRVLINGQEATDRVFTLAPGQKAMLTIQFLKNATEGKRHFVVKPVSWQQLDKINGEEPENFKFVPYGKYATSMNPLKKGLIALGIIIAALLIVWFGVLRRMLFPTFSGVHSYTVSEPFYSTKRFKGRRKIILTNRKPAHPQSGLSRLFTGEVAYDVNPLWTHPMEMTPCKKGAHLRTGASWTVVSTNGMPSPNTLRKGGEYLIESITDNTKVKLSVI